MICKCGCGCGCGKVFYPFPVYDKGKGGGLRYPEYIRGHHPNCKKSKPAWNKSLTKEVCPTLTRMGFQPGHEAYNDWSHVNEKLRNDPESRASWINSKLGQVAWNRGLTKADYPNGITSGENHGNWCGGHGGIRDTAAYKSFVKEILKRDHWTCQECGDKNHKGRGSCIKLHVHHKIALSENPELALDPSNVVTLCEKCHQATGNYGTKLIHQRRKRRGQWP